MATTTAAPLHRHTSELSPAQKALQLRAEQFSLALKLIRASLQTQEQLCDLLHTAGTTLAAANSGTLEQQDVVLIDALADVIQYRTDVEVEALIDCVKGGITTVEVEL